MLWLYNMRRRKTLDSRLLLFFGNFSHFEATIFSLFSFYSHSHIINQNQKYCLQISVGPIQIFPPNLAIAPTFALAFTARLEGLTNMNDWLNALMYLQIPFAILPLLTFTNDKSVMGKFR